MSIPWLYLDKELASINALKDYCAMERIIQNYHDDMRESKEFLTSYQPPMITNTSGSSLPNIRSYESRIASSIDRIDVVRERYEKAIEYMAWFSPAWNALAGSERRLLEGFFLREDMARSEAVRLLCEELHCEKSSIYRAKDKALGRLALLLYGK